METLLFVFVGLAIALIGAWEVSKHKHDQPGKLPEDIQ